MPTGAEVRVQLRKLVPERVGEQLTSAQKLDVVAVYQTRPGTVAAICQKSLNANSPYNYFVASIARVLDDLSQQPQPRAPRRPHDSVDCLDCADSGFVILHTHDAAPCHCPVGLQKMQKHTLVSYTRDDYDPVVVDQPLVSLVDYAQSEAGQQDPHLDAMRRFYARPQLPKAEER